MSAKSSSQDIKDVPVYRSCRLAIALVTFFGFAVLYAMRLNLTMAVVCMPRNDSLVADNPNVASRSQCWDGGRSNPSQENTPKNLFVGLIRTNILEMTIGALPMTTAVFNGDIAIPAMVADEVANPSILVHSDYKGEFDRDHKTKSRLLASFFCGYIVTQIPGGWLARRFGCRIVIGAGMLICALCSLLAPVFARTTVYLVHLVRIIAGISSGVVYPAVQCMWGRWVAPLERSQIPAAVYAGSSLGAIMTAAMSGVLCEYGFDNGWALIYVSGICAFLWLFTWAFMVYDTPRKHPRITPQERYFIENAIGDSYHKEEKHIKTPWMKILTSGTVWTLMITHICSDWIQYTLVTSLSVFLYQVHGININKNLMLFVLPYICVFISAMGSGMVADLIRKREWLNTADTRRVMQSISFFGVAIFITIAGFLSCEKRILVIVLLAAGVSFHAFNRAGYLVNHLDLAPRYAGEMFGLANTAGAFSGAIALHVNAALTPNGTQEEWQAVFFLCLTFALVGAIVFNLFVKGELASWAQPRSVLVDVPKRKKVREKKTDDVEEKKTGVVEERTDDIDEKKTTALLTEIWQSRQLKKTV